MDESMRDGRVKKIAMVEKKIPWVLTQKASHDLTHVRTDLNKIQLHNLIKGDPEQNAITNCLSRSPSQIYTVPVQFCLLNFRP